MIRKAVIVVLTLGAAVWLLAGIASFTSAIAMTIYNDRHEAEYLGFRIEDGFLNLMWSRTCVGVCSSTTYRTFDFRPMAFLEHLSRPWDFATFEIKNVSEKPLRTATVGPGPSVPHLRGRTHIYNRVGAHCAALFGIACAYPTITFIRGPLRRWRRRRKGLCQNCGYNLTGNVTGICSECGTEIESTGGEGE